MERQKNAGIRMRNGKKPELLAPAGDLAGLKAAIRFGADAVYIGGSFLQLRAKKVGFDEETLREAAALLHAAGKRLYVTVNAFAKNGEIPELSAYAKKLHALGVDAVIVSDLGAMIEIRDACPELEVHVSTQANCMNYRAAAHYHALGAKRVVLAREPSLEEIRLLRENTPDTLEIEAFVHGAMCMAYSGRCLLSAYLADRSGNRGACAQTCRWSFRLQEEKRPNEYYTIEETAKFSNMSRAGAMVTGKINSIGTPSKTFGITGGNWKCDDATVSYRDGAWFATLTWTRSGNDKGWDKDLYNQGN